MSGITNPIETFFKDGIWGWCVNQWKRLVCDAAGHLQIDVVTSGLPAGGATAANQATMITALELVDDLRAALNSVATDELDVVFDGQNLDVEITQTAPADLVVGNYGWDGAAWHKLTLLWGYSDRLSVNQNFTAAGAGNATGVMFTVPADYVYVVQAVVAWHNAGVAKGVQAYMYDGANTTLFIYEPTAVSGYRYMWQGELSVKEGDLMQIWCGAPGDGKKVYGQVWGYTMRVAE